jgi:penicillin-binding protein 1C
LASFYYAGNVPYTKLPPHNPACTRVFKGHAPVITSLTNGMTYLIENKEQQKLQLSCTTASDVHKVYWYINDRYFASSKANEKNVF